MDKKCIFAPVWHVIQSFIKNQSSQFLPFLTAKLSCYTHATFPKLVILSACKCLALRCAPCRALHFWLRRSKAERWFHSVCSAADWTTADKKERQRQKESHRVWRCGSTTTALGLASPEKNFTKSPVTHGKPTRQEIRG